MQESLKKLFDNGIIWLAEPNVKSCPLPNQTIKSSPLSIVTEAKKGLPLGIEQIDCELPWGGLAWGGIHEWFESKAISNKNKEPGTICLLPAYIAAKAWSEKNGNAYITWIGKDCWPTPFLLQQLKALYPQIETDFSSCCLFTDPPDKNLKLWAIETALKSQGVCAVIASCETLRFSLSRRMALAAEDGGSVGLFIRPLKDKNTPSAALSRWQIKSVPSPTEHPRWEIELLKCKGKQPITNHWIVELEDEATISLHIPSNVVDRSAESQWKTA